MSARFDRSLEVAAKLALLREALAQAGAAALRLRGVDWFAWATAGGSSAVVQAADTGAAQLLVTADEACILTDASEEPRLRDEEVPPGFEWHVPPWTQPELHEDYVRAKAAGGAVLSDRPAEGEQALPAVLRQQRMVLRAAEQQRYRALGQDAALAMGEVLRAAHPDWTEWELAGAAAQALWERGIQPALVLAAGARRLPLYRHPTPSNEPLGARAMLAFSARRHGLHASLTRFVSFGAAPQQEQDDLMAVEATGLAAVTPGNSLAAVYHALAQAYRHAGREGAILEHHQGGITGYAPHEIVATPSTATELEPGMAFALKPGFAGIAIEDTFLLGPDGLENLTFDPAWPAAEVQGRMRPLWLEAA